MQWLEDFKDLFKRVFFVVIFSIFLSQCYTKKVKIQLSEDSLRDIKGIIFLPIKSNFKIKPTHTYHLLLESADYVARNSNFFVLLPRDYKMTEECPFNSIFMCSGLRDWLLTVGILPSNLLFVEYIVAEETEITSTELSNMDKKINNNVNLSNVRYKIVTRLLHYSTNKEVYENRLYLKPDINSGNIFVLVSKHIKSQLSNIIERLNKYRGFVPSKTDLIYYVNPFQFFYDSSPDDEEICVVAKSEIDKEIEAQLFFEEVYQDKCKNCFNIMKNFSCGLLYEGIDFPFEKNNVINNGDFIVSFCGKKVFGLYSIKNALFLGNCLREKNVIVIRNSSQIELSL